MKTKTLILYPLLPHDPLHSPPSTPKLLTFTPIPKNLYQQAVEQWHSSLPAIPDAWAHVICYGAEYENILYAVAGWSKPVAKNLPQSTILELRRFAISNDAPKFTASRMLAFMAHDIRRRFPQITTLISYQDTTTHQGTIYKATGWTPAHTSCGDTWARHNRPNRKTANNAPKIRWQKLLNPTHHT